MELPEMGERVFAAECIQKKRVKKVCSFAVNRAQCLHALPYSITAFHSSTRLLFSRAKWNTS